MAQNRHRERGAAPLRRRRHVHDGLVLRVRAPSIAIRAKQVLYDSFHESPRRLRVPPRHRVLRHTALRIRRRQRRQKVHQLRAPPSRLSLLRGVLAPLLVSLLLLRGRCCCESRRRFGGGGVFVVVFCTTKPCSFSSSPRARRRRSTTAVVVVVVFRMTDHGIVVVVVRTGQKGGAADVQSSALAGFVDGGVAVDEAFVGLPVLALDSGLQSVVPLLVARGVPPRLPVVVQRVAQPVERHSDAQFLRSSQRARPHARVPVVHGLRDARARHGSPVRARSSRRREEDRFRA
mmetsp:Transcript_29702/g.90906  ORF Transcript_29702/g.90906 Transcript_29702/m.90906 type:complete len:290 (-) Transcript_29702:571-1440(-)